MPFIELANNSWDQIECDSSSSSFLASVCVCSPALCWNIKKPINYRENWEKWETEGLRPRRSERIQRGEKEKKTTQGWNWLHPPPTQLLLRDSRLFCPFQSARLWSHSRASHIFWSNLRIKKNKKNPLHYCLLSLAGLCDLAGRLYKETLLVLEAGRRHNVTTVTCLY